MMLTMVMTKRATVQKNVEAIGLVVNKIKNVIMTVFLLFYWDMNVLFLPERHTRHRDFNMMVNKLK